MPAWAVILGMLVKVAGAPGTYPPGVPSVIAPSPPAISPVLTGCWLETHQFRDLGGIVDYCRLHLRYVPGTLDCSQFADEVCSVFLPQTGEWVETRQPLEPVLIPCPDAPEPPVCPRLGGWH